MEPPNPPLWYETGFRLSDLWYFRRVVRDVSGLRTKSREKMFASHIIKNSYIFQSYVNDCIIIIIIWLLKSLAKWIGQTRVSIRLPLVLPAALAYSLFTAVRDKRTSLLKLTLAVGHCRVDTRMCVSCCNTKTVLWSFIFESISVRLFTVFVWTQRSQIWVRAERIVICGSRWQSAVCVSQANGLAEVRSAASRNSRFS